MPTPSAEIIQVLNTFAPAFTKPTFPNALVLGYGTLLAVGTRTVTAALRALGLAHRPDFTTYHRVLNRARWSPLVVSRLLLGLLVRTLLPADAPLVLAVDKRGPKPKKGRREPSLQARLDDPKSEWRTVGVPWYGGGEKTLEMMTGTSLWYRTGEDPLPIRWVLLRCPKQRQQSFPPIALFCTDPESNAQQIVGWFVGRWSIEVAFEEARAHLGMETQRQWSMRALGRSTPCLLGLFSVVVVLAKALHPEELPVRRAAWYAKEEATFVDALAAVRGELLRRGEENYEESSGSPDLVLIPRPLWDSVYETLCYAA